MTVHGIGLLNTFGVIVGLSAISLAMWSIMLRREYGAPYVASLYIIGSLFIVVYSTIGIPERGNYVIGAHGVLMMSVAYWVVMLGERMVRNRPIRNESDIY